MSRQNLTDRIVANVVGLEYDTHSIRAAKISVDASGHFIIQKTAYLSGDYQQEDQLIAGIRKIKTDIGLKGHRLITLLPEKQVYAAQLKFKKVEESHLKNALRLHLRKSIPFNIMNSYLEYQFLEEAKEKDEMAKIMVSVAAKKTVDEHLKLLSLSGLKPDMVDIHPVAMGNAQKLYVEIPQFGADDKRQTRTNRNQSPNLTLHIGNSVCSLVINGNGFPFYHRTIHFNTNEIFTEQTKTISEEQKKRRLRYFGDEIARSLSFYEKNHQTKGFQTIYLLGEHVEEAEIKEILTANTGLPILNMDFAALSNGSRPDIPKGRFELAISLALKGAELDSIKKDLYSTDIIRHLKEREKKKHYRRMAKIAVGTFCFGALTVAMTFTSLKIISMEKILNNERVKLKALENKYRKYKATRLIVDKGDIELLDSLQRTRIFWTRKLAAKAMHLPENYWITAFGFAQSELDVKGFGYISNKQRQLISLNDYLDKLRQDSTFNDDFKKTYFDVTERNDEGWRERVEFEYSAVNKLKPGRANARARRSLRRR